MPNAKVNAPDLSMCLGCRSSEMASNSVQKQLISMHSERPDSEHKVAGAAGFEPAHADTKNRCLTTWPRPNNATLTSCGHAHNSKRPLVQCLW